MRLVWAFIGVNTLFVWFTFMGGVYVIADKVSVAEGFRTLRDGSLNGFGVSTLVIYWAITILAWLMAGFAFYKAIRAKKN